MGEEKNGVFSCEACRELLYAYLSDMTDETQRALIEGHIAACPQCREELEEIKTMLAVLAAAPVPEVPAGFHAALHEKLLAAAAEMTFEKPTLRERITAAADDLQQRFVSFVTKANWRVAAPVMLGCVLVLSVFSTGLYQWMKSADDMLISEEIPVRQDEETADGEANVLRRFPSDEIGDSFPSSTAAPSVRATTRPSARATAAPKTTTAPRTTARPRTTTGSAGTSGSVRTSGTNSGTTIGSATAATPRPQATTAPRIVSRNEAAVAVGTDASGRVSVNEAASTPAPATRETVPESTVTADSATPQQTEETPVLARADAGMADAMQEDVLPQPVSGGGSGGSGATAAGAECDESAARMYGYVTDDEETDAPLSAYHISVYAMEEYLRSFPFAEDVEKDETEGLVILDLDLEAFSALCEAALNLGADITAVTPEEEEAAAAVFGEPDEDEIRIWFSEKTE